MAAGESRLGRFLKVLLPLLLLAAGAAGAYLLVMLRPRLEAAPPAERIWAVEAVRVAPRPLRPVIRRFGRLVAAREVQIEAPVAGRVLWVAPDFVDGARVREGQMLLRIDPFTYRLRLDELRAQLREARTRKREIVAELASERELLALLRERRDIAAEEVERQKRLVGRRVAARKNLDAARMEFIAQKTALRQKEMRIELLELQLERQLAVVERLEKEVERARRDLADTEIRAPFDGIVTRAEVARGRELRVGAAIGRIAALASLEIAFSLSDAEFGRLWKEGLLGREVVALWRTGKTEFAIAGRISRLKGRIAAETAGVGLYARIEDGIGEVPIRPGAFLEVRIPDVRYEHAVRLPRSALFGGDTVYVVEGGRLQPRKVRLLGRDGGDVLIEGALAPGERVVITRIAEIAPGLRVEIVGGES